MIIPKIIRQIKRVSAVLKTYILSKFGPGIALTHAYSSYNEYEEHQKKKTNDPERINKWLNEEWKIKLEGFQEIFQRNSKYVNDKNHAICLGARTGQEVKALMDLGVSAIGVDLVPFPPYTVKGDIHKLSYSDEEFDLVFTNIFDHSLYPDIFCAEMERVCEQGGIIIIHLQLGLKDDFTEVVVSNPQKVLALFDSIEVKESRRISTTFDVMNWELVLERR